MRLTVVIISAITILVAGRIGAAEPTDVGMVQLLANPEKFHGKFIRVEGFLRLEFEGDALYLHKEDYANGLTKNAVWVDMPQDTQHTKLNMHYVLIEGVFDAKDLGHMGLFSGSIGKISRAIAWK